MIVYFYLLLLIRHKQGHDRFISISTQKFYNINDIIKRRENMQIFSKTPLFFQSNHYIRKLD